MEDSSGSRRRGTGSFARATPRPFGSGRWKDGTWQPSQWNCILVRGGQNIRPNFRGRDNCGI